MKNKFILRYGVYPTLSDIKGNCIIENAKSGKGYS